MNPLTALRKLRQRCNFLPGSKWRLGEHALIVTLEALQPSRDDMRSFSRLFKKYGEEFMMAPTPKRMLGTAKRTGRKAHKVIK